MKKIMLMIALLLIAVPQAWAADDYKSLTVADTAVGFGTGIQAHAYNRGVCTLETAQIRFQSHPSASPTTTEGHPLETGQQLTLSTSSDIYYFKAIRTGGTSGVLKCSFWK